MDENKETIKALDRYLSPLDVWAMAFGIMVGWGVFAMPGNTFLHIAGLAGTLIAIGIGMVITLIIGSNFAFLMGRSSITGGALQTGIHYTIAGNVIYPAEALVSALVLGGVGLLFIVAKPLLQRLHTVLSLLLIAGVIVLTAACLPAAVFNGALTTFGSGGTGKGYAVFSLVILSPWAFAGFEVTSFDTAHFKFSIRRSWPLIVLSIVVAAFAYASMTLVSVSAVLTGRDYEDREAIMRALHDRSVENIGKGKVVVSGGLAEYAPGQTPNCHAVFEAADARMYEEKKLLKSLGAATRL